MSKLDAAFFKPFIDGTLNTMNVTASVQATPKKPYIKGTAPQPSFDIAGVIGLVSSGFTGTITLCFPEKVYLAFMSKMLGETYNEITDEVQDGVCELLNMIFGHAKVVLNQQGYTIEKAIPTVIRGKAIQTAHPNKNQVMVIPFETSVGEFQIEICADKK